MKFGNWYCVPDFNNLSRARSGRIMYFSTRSGSGIAILPLETVFIFGQEALEMMRQHPVKDCPLRMSRTIDSGHDRRKAWEVRAQEMRRLM
jgi:hypothetical protein